MSVLPSRREMKVLEGLCMDNVEDEAHFPGIGAKTFAAMLAKGWIKRDECETYGTIGYRITDVGENAHEAGYTAGIKP